MAIVPTGANHPIKGMDLFLCESKSHGGWVGNSWPAHARGKKETAWNGRDGIVQSGFMEPSFETLFSRSRYAGHRRRQEFDNDRQRQRYERERFLVAVLALQLSQDRNLKQHFLRTVCDVQDASPAEWKVVIEPRLCADLVLQRREQIFVIECKIGAPLDRKQNPEKGAFFKAGGYGKLIENRFPNGKLNYRTLGASKAWKYCGKKRERWDTMEPRTWKQFADDATELSRHNDLVDLFHEFDVPGYRTAIRNAWLSEWELKLSQARAQIRSAIKDPLTSGSVDKDRDYRDRWWYWGLNLNEPRRSPSTAKAIRRLREPVGKGGGKILGWVGYSRDDKDEGPLQDVWIYCQNGSAHDKCVQRLYDRGLRNHVVDEPVTGDWMVRIWQRAPAAITEQGRWFRDVISAVFSPSFPS